jgi:hypothetical protein
MQSISLERLRPVRLMETVWMWASERSKGWA